MKCTTFFYCKKYLTCINSKNNSVQTDAEQYYNIFIKNIQCSLFENMHTLFKEAYWKCWPYFIPNINNYNIVFVNENIMCLYFSTKDPFYNFFSTTTIFRLLFLFSPFKTSHCLMLSTSSFQIGLPYGGIRRVWGCVLCSIAWGSG